MSTDKKLTLYDRALDIGALFRLAEEAVDEESGEVRPISDEDIAVFEEWFNETRGNFDAKFDNICRFSANLKHEAKIAEAERDGFKDEMDRLSKRAKVANAKAARLRDYIRFALDRLGLKKYKTALFSAGVQNTVYSVRETSVFDVDRIPDVFLKKELSARAVREAVTEGRLYTKNDPLYRGVLFYTENGVERRLEGVSYSQGDTLVIR